MKTTLQQLIEVKRSQHILYSYHKMDQYIQTVVSFIHDGIQDGEYTLLIENERLHLLIQQELQKSLSEEQMKYVHFINSFHFYYHTSSYHPTAMKDYLATIITPYIEKQLPFRSWAHVEWATMKRPLNIIKDFENYVDDAINDFSFPLICAYNEKGMCDSLQNLLFETHPFIMTDHGIIQSEQYPKLHIQS